MATLVYPKTQILVKETNQFYTAAQDATDPTKMSVAISFAANTDTTAAKVYNLEVYTDDKATGVVTTVTVAAAAAAAPAQAEYQAASVAANPSTLSSAGGSTTVTVKFQAPAAS